MMKNGLLLLVFLCTLLSFGQESGSIVLTWTDNIKSSIGDKAIIMPQLQNEYFDYDVASSQVFVSKTIKIQGVARASSLQVNNIVYEAITVEQLGDLSRALPSAINAVVTSSKARDELFATLRFSPIIKEGNGYKRVKSLQYSFAVEAPRGILGVNDFNSVSNSVLASGSWYRFYVEKSGVYKVSKSFLQQLGLDTSVDPRNIKIYGNGGRMVPLLNSIDYPADLEENAIAFIGEEDGEFDSGDYILFYAEGVDNWSEENGTHNNLYDDRSYYYVTSKGGAGKRIASMVEPAGAPTLTVTTFDEYVYHEKDLVSVGRLGRKWHGETFNVENEQEFEFTIPNVAASPATINISAASNAEAATNMAVEINGQSIGNVQFSPLTDKYSAARDASFSGTFTPSGDDITVTLTYNNNGIPGSNAWLDYIKVFAKRNLQGNNRQFRFRYSEASSDNGIIQYQFSNASGIEEVWDITDIYNPVKIANETGSQFAFRAQMGEVRQYVTVVPNDYYTPLRDSKPRVVNQNIKGTIFNNSNGQFQDVDYLIVTPSSLNSQAERLANLHRNHSGLNVKVINLENIYQEFSSGKQDIGAIRNLVKYIYNNASSPDKRIKYVNLFGDASFDFKDRIPNNTNIVPIFHRYEPTAQMNYSIVNTFVSDDFFGLMDPDEGRMRSSQYEMPDVATGRMLVKDAKQAGEMVNKIEEYIAAESYGRWRNEYVLLSDDQDENGEGFVTELEDLGTAIGISKPFINVRKIHSDAFVQEASAGGQRYPVAKAEFLRAVNYGALVVNYLGHGNEEGMAAEQLYMMADAENLTNRYKYPLFITATCEVTKFDNPYRPTVGERTYWNPSGGAISLVSTTRAILISAAYDLNERMEQTLFPDDWNDYVSIAEALRQAKVLENTSNLNCVSYIGDPALKLAIPRPKIILTEINGVPIADPNVPVLESLGYVTMKGKVTNEGGATITNYNGELEVTVFDKKIARTTLNNDGEGQVKPFTTLGETIFRGNASVTNGNFEFGFVVPRDIRIPVAEGRVSFYSKRYGVLEDQTGYDTSIKVGGVNENAESDTTGPTVRLYMNDESFVSGGITNDSPILLAFLEDEHGINTSSGIGHDIIGILDGDEANPFVMNDYYETELDNYKKGTVRFPFTNLEKGLHTLTFKAWDVYNNLVTAEIQFVVVGDDNLKLEKVLNYPNPFVSYTEFWFNHNRPFEPLDVQVQIFTVTGKIVKTINQSVTTDGFLCRDIKWDGKDDFGDRIGKGVYVYKLTVRSTTTNKTVEKFEKLVLL